MAKWKIGDLVKQMDSPVLTVEQITPNPNTGRTTISCGYWYCGEHQNIYVDEDAVTGLQGDSPSLRL